MINKHFIVRFLGLILLLFGIFIALENHIILYKSSPSKHSSFLLQAKESTLLETNSINEGDFFGFLHFPKLDKTLEIYEGINKHVLNKGIGHYLGSSFPGEVSNSILSGHRDTYFRLLEHISEKDILTVETDAGEFLYKVRKIEIVNADDQTILTPKSRPIITLITCYPFSYIGKAPKRLIVTADFMKKL